MQILLIQDVAKLGRVGDLVDVKPGYARNYLIPQSLAIPATKGALKQADQLRQTAEKRRIRERASAEELAAHFAALVFRFKRKVGDKGRLYGSVTSTDIAERVEEELGSEIDKRKIDLGEPIKQLGLFEVPLNFHLDVPITLRVEVVGEEGETAADFAEEEEEGTSEAEAVAEGAEPVAPSDPQPDGEY